MMKDKQNRADFDMVVTPTPSLAIAGKMGDVSGDMV